MSSFNTKAFFKCFCHDLAVAFFVVTLETHQAYTARRCQLLNFAESFRSSRACHYFSEYGSEKVNLAATSSRSTICWVTKLTQVNVANADIAESLAQSRFRKARPSRLGTIAYVNENICVC